MEFIAEILVELIFVLAFILLRWCLDHKSITVAILAVMLAVLDVFVLMKLAFGL